MNKISKIYLKIALNVYEETIFFIRKNNKRACVDFWCKSQGFGNVLSHCLYKVYAHTWNEERFTRALLSQDIVSYMHKNWEWNLLSEARGMQKHIRLFHSSKLVMLHKTDIFILEGNTPKVQSLKASETHMLLSWAPGYYREKIDPGIYLVQMLTPHLFREIITIIIGCTMSVPS